MGSLGWPEIWDATLRSLLLSSTVAIFSGLLGCAFAWLVSRSQLPGGRMIEGLLALPYAIPAYLLGMAWIVLGNPRVGLLRDFLPTQGCYGFWGMAWVETTVAFAFPYLELKAGFDRLDPALEEAARMSGARPLQVFRQVSLPLLWPSLVNGMCLAFLYTLASFGVPALLGLPVRQFTLSTEIYSLIKLGGMAGIGDGLKLSGLLLAIALVVLFVSHRLVVLQLKRGISIQGAKSSRPSRVDLGGWKLPAAAFAWGFLFLALALPWCGLALSALAPVAGRYSPAQWTGANIARVFSLGDFREGLLNSVILALVVASLITAAGFVLGYLSVRKKSRFAALTTQTLAILFATPGTVLAILVIWISVRATSWIGFLDSALIWLGLAYALKHSAIGARGLQSAFRQVHPALEEAARVSGAGPVRVLRDIWAPLLKGSLIAAWLLCALPILTELTMSVLLTGPGAATLGTVLFQLQDYGDQAAAAALAWMLLTLALIVSWFTRGRPA